MNKKIILASKSLVKKEALSKSLIQLIPSSHFDIVQIDADAEGSEPFGEDAIVGQILEEIKNIKVKQPDADFYIAMEGGVRETDAGMEEVAFVIVEDNKSRRSLSRSVSFPVPPEVAQKVREGMPFGDAVDQVYSTENIKGGQGFVGLLTNGVVNKEALYFQPIVVALSKFLKEGWFWE